MFISVYSVLFGLIYHFNGDLKLNLNKKRTLIYLTFIVWLRAHLTFYSINNYNMLLRVVSAMVDSSQIRING